jgi:hypothetical protein
MVTVLFEGFSKNSTDKQNNMKIENVTLTCNRTKVVFSLATLYSTKAILIKNFRH